MADGGIGESVRRKEDQRFLTGKGTYTDDINRPGQTHAAILRSPHAHAAIKSIRTDRAASAQGVVFVFTGSDMADDGVGSLPCGWGITQIDGTPMAEPPHPVLQVDRVRHVGDPVAVVVAETRSQARDALDLIEIEYEVLPAAIATGSAADSGTPRVHDEAQNNICFDWEIGEAAPVEEALSSAAHVTTLELINTRMVTNAVEPRSAVAEYDAGQDRHTLWTTSQNPHVIRLLMGAFVLNIPEHKLRVVSPDVGGGFGSKIFHYAEEALVTWAAKKIGRPEATYLIERLIDKAADETGVDPAELRRRNMIPADAFPYQTPVALAYDSGTYEAALDQAMQIGDYAGFEKRREEASKRGKLRGIGVCAYIEACGAAPSAIAGALGARAGLYEAAEVRFHPTGMVSVFTGSQTQGQGHETTFAQIVAGRLGVPYENVEVVHGDTDRIPFGMGTYGSRSLAVGGSAIAKAIDKIVDKGKKIAAHILEASEGDIEFSDGTFTVSGTDKTISIGEVAGAAYVPHNYPLEELEPGLDESAFYDPANFTFPAGTQICEIEIDPDTGVVEIVSFKAVDDFGNIINPMIVEGQVHGGIVHGVGQALMEHCVYDSASGQLVTGSFNDYCMPRADDVPSFEVATRETPCPHNPLGVKGCGEAGTIGGAAAVMNAVADALSPLGISHINMPATPMNVWQAIQEAKQQA